MLNYENFEKENKNMQGNIFHERLYNREKIRKRIEKRSIKCELMGRN